MLNGYATQVMLRSYVTQLCYVVTLCSYVTQLCYTVTLHSYVIQLCYTVTLQLCYTVTLYSYVTQLRYTIAQHSYATQLRYTTPHGSVTRSRYTVTLYGAEVYKIEPEYQQLAAGDECSSRLNIPADNHHNLKPYKPS